MPRSFPLHRHSTNTFIWFDQVGFNIGILYAYTVGAAGHYMLLNLMCLAVPILFVLLFIWMPETPQYLLSKGKSAEAAKSLQWLRGRDNNVDHELQQLKVSDQHLATSIYVLPVSLLDIQVYA